MKTWISLCLLIVPELALVPGCSADPAAYVHTNGGEATPAEKTKTYRYSFDANGGEDVLAPFESILGKWRVETDSSAPSAPTVLRQTNDDLNDPDFPRIVLRNLTFKNARVAVRCKPERGDVDQACGVMFRFRDSDNYYITRANALEGNVRLYRVIGGKRSQIGSASVPVARAWHSLEAIAEGDKLKVLWDGQPLIDVADGTFAEGKIGLWTKADSVTAFDELTATEL